MRTHLIYSNNLNSSLLENSLVLVLWTWKFWTPSMPWSLLRNTESKFLIYTGTDMLTVAFVYLSSRSKQRQKKIRFVFFRHGKAYRCHCINLSISTMNCIFIYFFSFLPFLSEPKMFCDPSDVTSSWVFGPINHF